MNKYRTVKEITGKGYKYIVDKNGNKSWYLNGNKYREDGPAYIGANGNKIWYINGRNYGDKEPDNWICLVIEYKLMGN